MQCTLHTGSYHSSLSVELPTSPLLGAVQYWALKGKKKSSFIIKNVFCSCTDVCNTKARLVRGLLVGVYVLPGIPLKPLTFCLTRNSESFRVDLYWCY